MRKTTGQMDWSGGVDSDKVTTIAGPGNPNGLRPSQVAWMNNATVRGGGISPRGAYRRLARFPHTALFQEAYMYEPDNEFPYIIAQIGGRTFRARVDLDAVPIDEITVAGSPNPADRPQAWMCQAEQFLVIQDGLSTPLVWDGNYLQRVDTMPATPANAPRIPVAEAMDYYQGRLWLGLGREYVAGDIVGGPSGTPDYEFRDSVLNMVENTYLSQGGTFRVPTNAGNIRAIKHANQLDTAAGQGQLFVFTRESIYSVNVVPTRTEWQNLREPIQRVVQNNFGTTSDRSVVPENGDLFYRAVDGIRSLVQAVRYFDTWGNRPISVEEARAIEIEDRSMLRFASGISFDNRVLQTALPFQTDVGVAFRGLLPLNFDQISTLAEQLPPAWEGIYESLDFLRVLKGDFGGRQRAFAIVRSQDGFIELWEMTSNELFDTNASGEARITWAFETPSFTWETPFQLKKLDTIELWIDRLFGTVDFLVEFRPDQHACWEYWFKWQECSPRSPCDTPNLVQDPCYPTQQYRQQYLATMVLPRPPENCSDKQARPINWGYSFQFRITVKGFCRFRGFRAYAFDQTKPPFQRLVCGDSSPATAPQSMFEV